ncbi:hypothetical protein J6590_015282 [Homalodisca vitripennis]|nr:hypothetical protein J6590_015282 [Homalodisca vitripennis]
MNGSKRSRDRAHQRYTFREFYKSMRSLLQNVNIIDIQVQKCERNFTKFDSGRVEGTKVMLDSLDKKEKEQNRASLKHIIDTTIFCGKNEIPLRGHWATDGRNPLEKEGNFRALLGYRSN